MGYELFFINETKKQIVGSKRLNADFEDGNQLLAYLSMCCGDTIRIVGETDSFIETHVWAENRSDEYKKIDLFSFQIGGNRDECESEIERLYDEIG